MTIYPTSTINHETRIKIGLDSCEIIVADYYLYRSMTDKGFEWFSEPNNVTANIVGLSSSLVSKADTTLQREGYLEKQGSKKRITHKYLMAVKVAASGQQIRSSNYELARFFLDKMQEVVKELGCNIKTLSSSNKATLKSVALLIANISSQEVVREKDLEMIIVHKVKTWGFTDNGKYIRPATLLRSAAKYREYLMNAKQYWKTELNK